MGNILIFIEKNKESVKRVSLELITAARKIAFETGKSVTGIIFGNPSDSSILKEYGLNHLISVSNENVSNSLTAMTSAISQIAKNHNFDTLLFGANATGLELAPRVAARFDGGYISDCTGLEINGDDIIAHKPVYAGKSLIKSKILKNVKVFSLRPNVFTAVKSDADSLNIESVSLDISSEDLKVKVIDVKRNEGKLDVSEADIIVSGGRGLKGPENYSLIENLAAALGGAVGASRAVVDAGWRPHSEQVGQTGKTVSPNLYVACAISGAVQHLAGMSTSKTIVAINKDKDAPILKVADYSIVGDIFEVLPKLTAKIKEIKNS